MDAKTALSEPKEDAMVIKVEERLASDLERAADIERRHRQRAVELSAEIAALEPNVGKLTFDAEMAGESSPAAVLVEQLAMLRSERDVAEQAAAAAFDRQCELHLERQRHEAEGLRRQATAKRREAGRYDAKTTELLEQLKAHEGCEYVSRYDATLSIARSMPAGVMPSEPILLPSAPLSVRLRAEADDLDGQADAIAARVIPAAGQVIADSIDDLLAAVHELGLVRAPDDASIREWAAQVGHAERIARTIAREGGRVRLHLSWREGRIADDAHASVVSVMQLVEERWRSRATELGEERRAVVDARVSDLVAAGARSGEARDRILAELRPAWDEADRAERAAIADTI